MQQLNYKFRLYPTAEQERILGRTMQFARRAWNRMVQFTRVSRRFRSLGRAADIHNQLADFAAQKLPTGRRISKLHQIASDLGISQEAAMKQLNAAAVAAVWKARRSGLDVKYGVDRASAARQDSLWGNLWFRTVDKYTTAWKACWEGVRKAPRKRLPETATWLQAQVLKGQFTIGSEKPPDDKQNWVSLSVFFPPRMRRNTSLTRVRFLHHRPLPEESLVKQLTVTRASVRPGCKWEVVFTVEIPDEACRKEYPSTGLACGIDPGRKIPITLVGEDAIAPGVDGEEHDPGRPFHRAARKLRRLQRKLDRQTRANNPDCFREDGTWIKGRKKTVVSNGMRQTQAQIEKLTAQVADIRRDYYSRTADEILRRYDDVYIGHWTDGSPAAKGKAKRERRKAFEESGTKRKKGEAARQATANRIDRDNALGIFRQILNEKAKRSTTPKRVESVKEFNTTRQCIHCGAMTGPTGLKGLKVRETWTCSECGHGQLRDRGAAWNILQAGRASQAAAPAVTGESQTSVARTRKRKGAQASGSGRARQKSGRASVVHASGTPAASSSEALATPQLTHVQGHTQVSSGSGPAERAGAAEPLAKDNGLHEFSSG